MVYLRRLQKPRDDAAARLRPISLFFGALLLYLDLCCEVPRACGTVGLFRTNMTEIERAKKRNKETEAPPARARRVPKNQNQTKERRCKEKSSCNFSSTDTTAQDTEQPLESHAQRALSRTRQMTRASQPHFLCTFEAATTTTAAAREIRFSHLCHAKKDLPTPPLPLFLWLLSPLLPLFSFAPSLLLTRPPSLLPFHTHTHTHALFPHIRSRPFGGFSLTHSLCPQNTFIFHLRLALLIPKREIIEQ